MTGRRKIEELVDEAVIFRCDVGLRVCLACMGLLSFEIMF